MPKNLIRSYSGYTTDAVQLLANLIKIARKEKKRSVQDIADRVGVSRGLIERIEKGDMKCEIGVVFQTAAVLGIKLFDLEKTTLNMHIAHTEEKLALLPKSIRKDNIKVDDDF